MILFSGTSNPLLSKEIADLLGVSLGNVEVTRFIDSECRVRILDDVKDQDVYVLQSLSQIADQHLVELCLFATALKSLGAKTVTAVIPWMGYSKQDKSFRKGEAVSVQLVAKVIEVAGFDRVICCELHSETVIPYFAIPVTELSTQELLASARGPLAECVVASPDTGGKSRSNAFAKHISAPIVYLEKQRNYDTGHVSVTGIAGDVKGKTVVIFDDIINTGATAVETSAFVKKNGATRVLFLATHAVFAGDAVSALTHSTIDHVIVTDTITIAKEKQFPTLTIVSVSSLLATAIASSIR
ncbi:MAG: ribose-phosphate pyrophosphokinase [Patescibacteria group bacterium]